ncbi:MAG: hypothetical protein ABSF38_19585, partial [Verrucomicrobiota bacterium]
TKVPSDAKIPALVLHGSSRVNENVVFCAGAATAAKSSHASVIQSNKPLADRTKISSFSVGRAF